MKIIKEITGSGEDIVIIHGGLANSDDMQIIANELSNHYRVTCINSPDNGKSDMPDSVKTVHDIADAILPELPEKAIYIGHSNGGLTCQSIAARYPARVKRFIGIAATPKFIASENWIGLTSCYEQVIMPLLENTTLKSLLSDLYNAEFANINPKPSSYYHSMKICDARPDIPLHNIKTLLRLADSTDLRQEFKQLTCPIDIIIGEQDSTVPKAAFAQIKALNPRVNLHSISGAGHMLFATHPQEFNQILQKILLSN